MFKTKLASRFLLILSNAMKQISAQVINILVSIIIINYYNAALWGSFTSYIIFTSLIATFTSWGNKEYLLREFSRYPAKINQLFYEVLNARLALLIIAIAICFLCYNIDIAFYLAIWTISIYITQSIEVLINFRKKFAISLLIESLLFIFLIVYLFNFTIENVSQLIAIYSLYQLLRATIYAITFIKAINKPILKIKKQYFAEAGFFFLLSMVGFLQSRIDFIIFSFFEKPENTAIYQVINSYFILIHAIGTFLIFPFIKNIYRLNESKVSQLQNYIIKIAPIIVLSALLLLYFMCRFIYHFELTITIYLIGILIVYPPYFYAVKIFQLFKNNQQHFVLKTGIIAIIATTIISIVLLSIGLDFIGVMLASAVGHIYTAFCYNSVKLKDAVGEFYKP